MRSHPRNSPEAATRLVALAMIAEWTAKGEAKSVGLLGNAADVFPELVARMKAGGARPDIVTDQTSALLALGRLPLNDPARG